MPSLREGAVLDLIHRARPWQVGAILRAVLGYRRGERDAAGFRLWLDPASDFGYRILRHGGLEGSMEDGFKRLLRPGDSVVDLGGNEAWYSLLAGRHVGATGRVLCVEPQERLWPVVLRNFALNHMPQCTLVPLAAGPEGRAAISLAPEVNTGASSMTAPRAPWRKHQEVLVRPLTRIVDEHGIPKVRLLKVDIEGFELNALLSGESLLADHRVEHILMELHDRELAALGQSRDDVLALLSKYGYREVSEQGGVYHFAAPGAA